MTYFKDFTFRILFFVKIDHVAKFKIIPQSFGVRETGEKLSAFLFIFLKTCVDFKSLHLRIFQISDQYKQNFNLLFLAHLYAPISAAANFVFVGKVAHVKRYG